MPQARSWLLSLAISFVLKFALWHTIAGISIEHHVLKCLIFRFPYQFGPCYRCPRLQYVVMPCLGDICYVCVIAAGEEERGRITGIESMDCYRPLALFTVTEVRMLDGFSVCG